MYGKRNERFEIRLTPEEKEALLQMAEAECMTAAEIVRRFIRQRSMTVYVYIESEPGLYTVGFYSPDGRWHTDSDHTDRDAARERVHYLNGGDPDETPSESPTSESQEA